MMMAVKDETATRKRRLSKSCGFYSPSVLTLRFWKQAVLLTIILDKPDVYSSKLFFASVFLFVYNTNLFFDQESNSFHLQ